MPLHGWRGMRGSGHVVPLRNACRPRDQVAAYRTVQLALAAMAVALVFAIPLGIVSAVFRGTFVDHAAMTLSLVGISMPNFWLGPLLAILFAVQPRVASGRGHRHPGAPGAACRDARRRAGRDPGANDAWRACSRNCASCTCSRPVRVGSLARARSSGTPSGTACIPVVTIVGLQFGAVTDRDDHHRDDFRLARRRPASDPVDQLSRLPARAGLHPFHLDNVTC